jgi:hypothetical protein
MPFAQSAPDYLKQGLYSIMQIVPAASINVSRDPRNISRLARQSGNSRYCVMLARHLSVMSPRTRMILNRYEHCRCRGLAVPASQLISLLPMMDGITPCTWWATTRAHNFSLEFWRTGGMASAYSDQLLTRGPLWWGKYYISSTLAGKLAE